MSGFLHAISRPIAILLGCLLLSAVQVVILFLSSWYEWRTLDFGSLSIAFSLIVPLSLSLALPLLVVLARAPKPIAGIAQCIVAVAVIQVLRVALAQLVDPSPIVKAANASCATAAQDLVLVDGSMCVGWSFFSQLLLNALWWAFPLALLALAVRFYEHRRRKQV